MALNNFFLHLIRGKLLRKSANSRERSQDKNFDEAFGKFFRISKFLTWLLEQFSELVNVFIEESEIFIFMYRRPILCTLYGAVDFLNVLKKYIMYL
jgi:hypothetical protein